MFVNKLFAAFVDKIIRQMAIYQTAVVLWMSVTKITLFFQVKKLGKCGQ
jgi:hypothetical protein